MEDRRVAILKAEHQRGPDHVTPEGYSQWVLNAMDENGHQMCLDLLEYMAKHKVICGHYSSPDGFLFKVNGHELLTKEQLFENFL